MNKKLKFRIIGQKIFLKSSEASRPYTKSVCNIVVSYTHAESQVNQSK